MMGSVPLNITSTNLTIDNACRTTYIDYSLDPNLQFALLMFTIFTLALVFLFDFKLKNKYAKYTTMWKLSGSNDKPDKESKSV